MPKRLIAIALVAAACGSPSIGLAATPGDFYLGVSAGVANWHAGRDQSLVTYAAGFPLSYYKLDDTDAAGGFRFGYVWHSRVDIAIEGGWVRLGRTDLTWKTLIPDFAQNAHVTEKSRGLTAGVRVRLPIGNRWHIGARGGVFMGWLKRHFYDHWVSVYQTVEVRSFDGTQYHTGVYGGVDVGYDLTPRSSVGVAYDYYHNRYFSKTVNIGAPSVTFVYRF